MRPLALALALAPSVVQAQTFLDLTIGDPIPEAFDATVEGYFIQGSEVPAGAPQWLEFVFIHKVATSDHDAKTTVWTLDCDGPVIMIELGWLPIPGTGSISDDLSWMDLRLGETPFEAIYPHLGSQGIIAGSMGRSFMGQLGYSVAYEVEGHDSILAFRFDFPRDYDGQPDLSNINDALLIGVTLFSADLFSALMGDPPWQTHDGYHAIADPF